VDESVVRRIIPELRRAGPRRSSSILEQGDPLRCDDREGRRARAAADKEEQACPTFGIGLRSDARRDGRQQRGQLFSKLARQITIALEPAAAIWIQHRPEVRVDKARQYSMPKDNIERAIKKGTGELAGGPRERAFDAIGPGGVFILIEVLTDNRTARHRDTQAAGDEERHLAASPGRSSRKG